MTDKITETHYTCTSSDLPGLDKEHLNTSALNNLFQKLFGTKISNDPATARLQREQAIARYKQLEK